MPGAGGNFFSRILNLHPEINWHSNCYKKTYEEKYNVLNYQTVINRIVPHTTNWLDFEGDDVYNFPDSEQVQNLLRSSHFHGPCEIRITNYTKKEWNWARRQLLWKDSLWSLSFLNAGQGTEHDVGVPVSNLWEFESLRNSVCEVEKYMKVSESTIECWDWREKLWNEWKQTWAPEKLDQVIDKLYYGPKE